MLQTIRKRLNNKGFTLVELIVVLVILAILAALLIPSLTGYIDRARQESIVAETRMVVLAAQTVLSEDYGKDELKDGGTISYPYTVPTGQVEDPVVKALVEEIHTLSETTGNFEVTYNEQAKVTGVEYTNNGLTCKYEYNETTGESSYVCPAEPDTPDTTSLFGTSGNPDGSASEFVFA